MELKKFWVRGHKSLRDVTIELPTMLTAVAGPCCSGKTALIEALGALRRGAGLGSAAVGVEVWDGGCRVAYEVGGGRKTLMATCGSGEAEEVVQKFLGGLIVIGDIDWKAVRGLKPAGREERLLPDASNFIPFLYAATGGAVPDSLVEALRYALPSVSDLRLAADGGVLVLRLTTEDGAVMTQASMPTGALKTLIIETALMMRPSMIAVDNFECGLDAEAQQFLIDELRSRGVYALITTHSDAVLDYVKPEEVVLLRLSNGEAKARRLGGEVEEALKRHRLTLSELIHSGLLEQ